VTDYLGAVRATAAMVLANAKSTVTPATEEADVKAALAEVMLGEGDPGVVYGTGWSR
jgi:hypothetical protein